MITIVGSGVSGLLAALACEDTGNDFKIISDSNIKPKFKGFQYLHDSCGLSLPPHTLLEQIMPYYENKDFRKIVYSMKVYGNKNTTNSMDKVLAEREIKTIYNMDYLVDVLWNRFSDKMYMEYINGLKGLEILARNTDMVISTIPLNLLIEEAKFSDSWLLSNDIGGNNDNYVVYDLGIHNPVYRYGILFNNLFFESSTLIEMPDMKLTKLKKVITLQNPPKLDKIVLTGRYGKWDKSILAHDVYYEIKGLLSGKSI